MMGATTEFDLQFFGTAQLGEYQTSLMVRSNGGEAPLTLAGDGGARAKCAVGSRLVGLRFVL